MTTESASGPIPSAAVDLFGERLDVAARFVELLADTGVSHGLIGPREIPRLWGRHVLNCAVVAEAMPRVGADVIDVGSGAGLPGIAIALARPDLHVTLVEPMLRRTTWAEGVIEDLGLSNVTVARGRAEDFHGTITATYVTARAVARLEKLLRWCAPLVAPGGDLVAMKGASAEEELTAAGPIARRLGLRDGHVRILGTSVLEEPTTVVVLRRPSAY